MDPIKRKEKYPKAKIDEPNLRLPKAMLKPDTDWNDDLNYIIIFEDDTRRAQHLAEAIAAGAKLDRRVYRIRNKELAKFVRKDFEGMSDIQRASKATIGILADDEANFHRHAYLDLMGTVEEVSTAEGLILDNTLMTYSTLAYPVILMPPTIHEDYIIIPDHKVSRVVGTYNMNIMRMEMESGAWIKIEPDAPPGGSNQEKLIRVFGPREHVIKAINLIKLVTYEPAEPSAPQVELQREFHEPYWRDFFERKEAEDAKLKEYSCELQGAEEGGSDVAEQVKQQEGSKQKEGGEFKVPPWSETFGHMKKTEEEGKQQQTEEGGGSGLQEKEKLQEEHVEQEAEGEEPEDRSQEDVEEVGTQDLKEEAKLKDHSGEPEKGKQHAEQGGCVESRSAEAGESVKEKKPKKLIIRFKESKEKREEEDVEEGRKDKESSESEKGKLQAEEGGSAATEKGEQPEHVEELADSAKTEDDKEGGRSKEKRRRMNKLSLIKPEEP